MTIGVILNRVFRINNNPLFEYIHQNKEELRMLPHYSTGNIRRRWHKHESKLLLWCNAIISK